MTEIINYLIEASIYGALTYITFLWLRNHASFAIQRGWLLAGVLFSICVPFLDLGSAAGVNTYSWQLPAIYVDESLSAQSVGESYIQWPTIIYWTYMLGLLITGMRFIYGCMPIITWLTKGKRKEENGLDFIYHEGVEVPFSFGPYIFWNPEWEYSEVQKRMILLHESVHIRKKHTLDLLILQLLKVVAWFHPLVYLYDVSLKDIHEFEADQATLSNHKRKDYFELLLQHLFRARWVLGHSIFQSPIQKRIKMMKSMNKQRTSKRMMAMALMLMFSTVLYLGCNETTIQSNEVVANEDVTSDMDKAPLDASDKVFQRVEEMPRFPGCEGITDSEEAMQCSNKNMLNWVMDRIKYPEAARENNTTGMVLVSFVVDKEGKVQDPTIVKDLGHGTGEEIIRIVNQMNEMDERWEPGKHQGRKVKVKYYLPVRFESSDK